MTRSARAGVIVALAALLAVLAGLILAARIQAGDGVSVSEVHFRGASGARMRGLLFRPVAATSQAPAPAILAVHGYLNSAEMQGNFATEFARRGYVVLAPDQRGHGGSDPAAFADGFGGPDALAYLRSLPFVDRGNIGLEGHSMGGWTVLSAAKAQPEGYKSLILEGSSVGAPFAPDGTTAFPRNLLVVYGTRDEFGEFMWGPEAPLATGAVKKIRDLFGTSAPVEPGHLYGNAGDGSARMLLTPGVVHAWLHQSSAGIAPAINWFARTLEGARPMSPADQIWPWREAGDLVALIALPLMIAGLIAACQPRDGGMKGQASREAAIGSGLLKWRGELAIAAIVPALLFIPACQLTEALLGQNALFRQTFTNQFVGWATVVTVLSVIALRRKGADLELDRLPRAVPVALVALVPAYLLVLLSDRLLHVNPSWWFVTIRPVSAERTRDFLLYAPFFVASSLASLRLVQVIDPLERGGMVPATLRAMAALGGGFVLFLAAQFGVLVATGHLLLPSEGLRVIQAVNFAVFLMFVGLFGAVSQRQLGSVVPGGLVSGLVVAWAMTATQPIAI